MMSSSDWGFTGVASLENPSHAISDDESLEDHSGMEDFTSVTLQMNDDNHDNNSARGRSPTGLSNTTTNVSVPVSTKIPTEKTALLTSGRRNSESGSTPDHVPRISITPMTPPSASISPEGHSTVSLNSSGGSPLFQNQKYRGQMSMSPNLYWRPQSPMPPKNEYEAKEFFAYRDSIVQNVMDELQSLAVFEVDGNVHGTWLLTEIDHWDNEKERIVLMCEKSMIIVKYDFIAMKQEDHRRIFLGSIDKIVQGELKYPERSLAPTRNVQGMRVMWNQDLPLSFTQKWNPFNKTIPWITFASHPLLWHKGGGGGINRSFDIDSFLRELMDILSHGGIGGGGGDTSPMCRIEYKPIIIETYVGLASLFHNANSLGFYKVRGKVSF